MKNIIESSELPEGEKVYLKKDYFGWRIVNPIKNEDGSYNYVNLIFGGKRNFALLVLVMALIFIFFMAYNEVGSAVEEYSNNACKYCELQKQSTVNWLMTPNSINKTTFDFRDYLNKSTAEIFMNTLFKNYFIKKYGLTPKEFEEQTGINATYFDNEIKAGRDPLKQFVVKK